MDHGQQQTDTTHFPILIEEKANENDAASLIFFCKALENVLVDAPQQVRIVINDELAGASVLKSETRLCR